MGYFEGLTRGSFKQSADGRHVFYPWGIFGRGYFLSSDQEYEVLKRRVKSYHISGLGLVALTYIFLKLQDYPTVYLFFALPVMIPYILWAKRRCRQLQPADVRLTLRESLENSARGYGWIVLIFFEIFSILIVVIGVLLLIFEPDRWLLWLIAIAGSGVGATFFTFMLIAKWRGRKAL